MNLQVGVKVLLKREDGKILLIRRNAATYADVGAKWDIPGGRIEPGSSLMDNLAREVREETALSLTSSPMLIAAQDIIKEDERHVVRLTYTAHTTGEPVLDTLENDEFRWASFREVTEEAMLDSYVRALIDEGTLSDNSWTVH